MEATEVDPFEDESFIKSELHNFGVSRRARIPCDLAMAKGVEDEVRLFEQFQFEIRVLEFGRHKRGGSSILATN